MAIIKNRLIIEKRLLEVNSKLKLFIPTSDVTFNGIMATLKKRTQSFG
jgi:hypothetical protein